MSEKEQKVEISDEEMKDVSGGGDGLIFKISAPQFIFYKCERCANVTSCDHTYYQQGILIPKIHENCGGYYKIMYHCPACHSEYVSYSGGKYWCYSCQKESNPDGTLVYQY